MEHISKSFRKKRPIKEQEAVVLLINTNGESISHSLNTDKEETRGITILGEVKAAIKAEEVVTTEVAWMTLSIKRPSKSE
jgi:hypothetical protein